MSLAASDKTTAGGSLKGGSPAGPIEQVDHKVFITTKARGQFIYEIMLERYIAVNQYRVKRRWYYSDFTKLPPWKQTDWHKDLNKLFDSKVIQKSKIMKYEQVE